MNVDEYIKALDTVRESLSPILETIKDTSRPLDERWSDFAKLSEAGCLATEAYGDGHLDSLRRNLSLYDDFYVERYEGTDYVSILQRIEEEGDYTPEEITNWKNKVLETPQYGAFVNDW